ncbi:dynamin family protein [Paucisalibacillus sp. EB02]|uniref:dynamin family protein n=1 Tax=Paucisalibacillus sp. EB02 TaxID=1347087 RepID=UPI0004B1B8FD|nr:dynamin family protein [Paucisalibacillus sp. EB02]
MKAIKQYTSVLDDDNLTGIYHVMKEHGDDINAEKVIDLYKKKRSDEFTISFTGHFSAGKSSIINALIGSDILPKSPIPTSANIVKLSSGEGVARLFFRNDDPIEYDEPYDLDMIKEYAKDKDTITKIEISSSKQIIPEKCAIIDTPGIDAADDTDRIITESSLHLVDVLFYVMDYNHVQSELNMKFLKNIQTMKIPFYIIINQIDKHNENELTFQSFDNSVKQTFDQWGLSPEAIYYSSLLIPDAMHNQFHIIKSKIKSLFTDDRIQRLDLSVKNILTAHKRYLDEKRDEDIGNLPLDDQADESLLEIVDSIQRSIETLKNMSNDFQNDYIEDLDHTLKNAYLMPANIRDKALNFLESQQKDFKIGFIGAKKKTEEERTKRLDDFLNSVKESMQASIEWKLREKFAERLKSYSITEQTLYSTVQQLSVAINEEDLLDNIKKGAQVNGDSVLNYTNDLASSIKNKYRKAARKTLSAIIDVIERESEEKQTKYKEQLQTYKELVKVNEEYQAIEEKYQKQIHRIENQLHTPEFSKETEKTIQKRLEKVVFVKGQTISHVKVIKETSTEVNTDERAEEKEGLPTVQRVVHAIDKTVKVLEDMPTFKSLVTELTARKGKLSNRQLTIALFGAFSAGKSSFANALIGEGVLPSSPNPTTAVINRITPVTEDYEHGTVVIHLKDQKTMLQDLVNILKHFSPPTSEDIGELVNWIKEHDIQNNDELSHMFQSYLQAILKGYYDHKELIGKSKTIHLEDFEAYVTDESKACFVESIDLYYDCSITKKGITLVDTPGADSVNARHTNVAFDYIKNADAILYVTYFNHAITKADKDFVMQLGRVKESFQLDKMFFIINASDLAQDNTELNLVVNYVKEQLNKLGIRNPRLYPISSKKSLKEKQEKKQINDQIHKFEEDFYAFLENELSHLAVKSAVHELKRSMQLVKQFKHKASLNEQEKSKYKQILLERKDRLLNTVDSGDDSTYNERVYQKISKQLHYVVERISIRFHDMFKDKFNPTTVTESGRKAIMQLERNTMDLLDYCGYELLQEARAVSLRIEAFINEQNVELMEVYKQKINEVDKDFTLPALQSVNLTTPDYLQPLQDLDVRMFKQAFSLFRGTKSFFEKNEKEKMKGVMYQILVPEIQQFTEQTKITMTDSYGQQWDSLVSQNVQDIQNEIHQYVMNSLAALEDPIDINILINKEKELEQILKRIH